MNSFRVPKDLEPIYKYDGEVLGPEDLKFLYANPLEQNNYETIALAFDVSPLHVFYMARKFKIHMRKEDYHWHAEAEKLQKAKLKRRIKTYDTKMYKEQAEKNRLLWDEALMLYNKPKPTQTYVVNGRERLDKGVVAQYYKEITEIFKQLGRKPTKDKAVVKLIRHVDLSAMRLHRGLNMFEFSQQSGIPYKTILHYEKTASVVIPEWLSNRYMKVLNISKSELKKIWDCLSGKRKTMFEEDSRNIPDAVREYVFKRDKGKCRSCQETNHLHFHHVTHFANGGKHEARNLKLLCVTCHAEAHHGDKGYHMLKERANTLMGVTV